MIKGNCVFTYISKRPGITKDGVKYLAFDVLTKDTKGKISFVVTDSRVIDSIQSKDFTDFQEVKCFFDISKAFNNEKRISYWIVDLIGVE